MFLQSIFISVISVSYYRLLVEIMSSTPVLAIKAIDASVIDAPVIDAPANTVAVKKVKKVRVPVVVPEAEAEADAVVTVAAVADVKKVKKVRVQALEAAAVGSVVPEKKKRVVKKPQEKEAAAVTEVVKMVADMKTAFTEATEATEVEAEVEVAATVVVEDADAELVLDAYIESSLDFEPLDFEPLELEHLVEVELGDSIVDFEALRLAGDETPCCNPIPEPIQEEEVDVASEVASEAVRPVRPVFRFEFSPECFELLSGFARENLGVPRKEYKAKWEQFATAHAEFIAQESARLADAGYDGDVLVKMFKTVKYYLTKRVKAATTASTSVVVDAAVVEHVEQVTDVDDDDATVDADAVPMQTQTRRRHYTTLDRAVLEAMDSHITASISSNSKPATCYASFCDQFRASIETEIARLVRFDGLDADVVRARAFTFTEKTAEEKLKKTYKNRMFLQIRNM
jgi:hypothetical protein